MKQNRNIFDTQRTAQNTIVITFCTFRILKRFASSATVTFGIHSLQEYLQDNFATSWKNI